MIKDRYLIKVCELDRILACSEIIKECRHDLSSYLTLNQNFITNLIVETS